LRSIQDILLTDKYPDRLLRHVFFWLGQLAFWAFMVAGFFLNASSLQYLKSDLRLHSYFIPDICYTYFVTYYLVERFRRHKNARKFILSLIALTIVTYFTFLALRFLDYDMFGAPKQTVLLMIWLYSMKFVNLGPPVICGMFLSLKFLKNYHKKSAENKALIAENTKSQLGLLKAQVHPHFLFNTLSNIHSFALSGSAIAVDLVCRLSAALRYMIFECEAPFVCLEKELAMIRDYTELERVRYSNSLSMAVTITGDVAGKQVAPLFLIPLIENAFKHGTSQVLMNPWINLRINVTDTRLVMDLSNSKPQAGHTKSERSGIGLSNVKKRLDLIYPNDHRLIIENNEDFFRVQIDLPLESLQAAQIQAAQIQTAQIQTAAIQDAEIQTTPIQTTPIQTTPIQTEVASLTA
jgi:two-component system, LytTR family, sensor kinase